MTDVVLPLSIRCVSSPLPRAQAYLCAPERTSCRDYVALSFLAPTLCLGVALGVAALHTLVVVLHACCVCARGIREVPSALQAVPGVARGTWRELRELWERAERRFEEEQAEKTATGEKGA